MILALLIGRIHSVLAHMPHVFPLIAAQFRPGCRCCRCPYKPMQVLNALPTTIAKRIACIYQNRTPDLQILRISNIANGYFERVTFPGDRLLFEAVPEAQLEIYSAGLAGLPSRLPCQQLPAEPPTLIAL